MTGRGTTHVIGGGVAGLSAALTLAEAGRRAVLHEAGPAPGGRCRSYDDRALGVRLDNGNHLLLSGNQEVFSFLRRIGSADTMTGPGEATFPFVSLADGLRWTLRLGRGRIPWWLLRRRDRVPGVGLAAHLGLLRLLRARRGATVAEALPGDGAQAARLRARLLDPLAIAILNTMPAEGSAALLADTFRASLLKGGHACVPAFPAVGLSETFVDPAVARLASLGVAVRTGSRIARLGLERDRVVSIVNADGEVALGPDDSVVLATPAPVAAGLLPGLVVPDRFEAIANVHFRTDLETPVAAIRRARFAGMIGGIAEWVFLKPGVVSVTISAANRFEALASETLVARVWGEVVAALGLPGDAPAPQSRLVRERRATFAATPAQENRRPGVATDRANLVLAGDWTATGLPATIEGAIKSGRTAAERIAQTA